MSDRVAEHLEARMDAIVQRLGEYVACPSVSTDPSYEAGMQGAREFLMRRLNEIGMDNLQLLDGGGHKAVYADWLHAPGKPTIIVYGHYDVQPPDPVSEWRTEPFVLTPDGDRLYARGASDNKGSSTIALESLGAYLEVEGSFPFNIRCIFEGEEEVGSATFPEILDRHRDQIKGDFVLSADGGRNGFWPAINVGCRGGTGFELTLKTAERDLHSGRYGGTTRNALHDLARLLSTLHDDEGRVTVEGFLPDTALPDEAARAHVAALGLDEDAFFASFGGTPHGFPEYSVLERLTLLPTVEINGIWGGYTGPGSKGVIPNLAHAKIGIRTVGNQDAGAALNAVIAHLQAHAPAGVRISTKITEGGGVPAYNLAEDSPLVIAFDRVLREMSDVAPVRVRSGGTSPITSIFRQKLGIDTLMFGFSMPEDRAHAPNESYAIQSLREGIRCWPKVITELGRILAETERREVPE